MTINDSEKERKVKKNQEMFAVLHLEVKLNKISLKEQLFKERLMKRLREVINHVIKTDKTF